MANNSIIDFDDITSNTPLLCITDNKYCCESNGTWLSPSGDSSTAIFVVERATGLLEIRPTSSLQRYNGIWACEIEDNVTQPFYVGLFTRG